MIFFKFGRVRFHPCDAIIMGLPRAGTTLTCHLLNKLPNTVALHEPIKWRSFPPHKNRRHVVKEISKFFNQTRVSIMRHGKAVSKNVNGEVRDTHFSEQYSDSGLRKSLASVGTIMITKPLSRDFLLCIKDPAPFTALLDSLIGEIPCYAIIRNPLSVLASWNSVEIPASDGHVLRGEDLDPILREALSTISDKLERQLYLLTWFFEKYLKFLPQKSILRYEDIVASEGRALRVLSPQADMLCEKLENKNRNKLYNEDLMRLLGAKLLKRDGPFWRFYAKESVELLLGHS